MCIRIKLIRAFATFQELFNKNQILMSGYTAFVILFSLCHDRGSYIIGKLNCQALAD
jgi:hypothetical protein